MGDPIQYLVTMAHAAESELRKPVDSIPRPFSFGAAVGQGNPCKFRLGFPRLKLTFDQQWVDVFSSLSLLRPPKFLQLWKQLLSEQKYWVNGSNLEMPQRLRMDLLSGCPDEAMLAIAEISALAHWKTSQLRNGSLSYPELIRRGTAIEQQLRQYPSNDHDTRLHGTADAAQPTQEDRSLAASIFREAAHLYLHSVLSNSMPGKSSIKKAPFRQLTLGFCIIRRT